MTETAPTVPTPPARPQVRPLRPEDHEAVAALTVASYVDGGHIAPGSRYVKTLRDVAGRAARAEVLVAEVDGQVAGSVVLTPLGSPMAETAAPGEYEFRMLAVHPDHHRRGVARTLMAVIEERARALPGIEAIALTTMPTMTDAHRLYEALGYVRVPERDWYLRDVIPDLDPADETGPFLVYRLPLA
ncbi:GNAT family N-acetyltransferase [Micrococcus endophyticus]|uniref:Ribosomal protein S18 acetylase RimI-like enzyme n=1 Tax=Micrococcus endophyticus TaxID=455343 RepID=A0A7W9JJH4_9MICC|nr:GNAT family N-acetyltransferase [Micrococcus endophyticus]MBB5848754.1 ribosomal protein S18 acetylase RimI-like enzyme [Micrococcus endophyticus]MCK6091622.1 GNAT family N-acetyltransferase [Micrococcus endophyticus]QCP08576.1 GNAT family N-acetyltransferase [Micrococcus luteus]